MKTTIERGKAQAIYRWLDDKNVVKFDKETRKCIIGICRALKPIATAYDEDRKAVQEKVFAGHYEALEKRSGAIAEHRAAETAEERKRYADLIRSYAELTPLDKEFSEIVADMDKEGVEVDVPQMDEDRFLDGCEASGIDVSVAILDDLAPFFRNTEV